MTCSRAPLSAREWFAHLFNAKSARDGGVVRRSVRDMERIVGRQTFFEEIHRRGFTAVENAGQVIVFCNAEPVRLITARRQNFPEIFKSNPQKDLVTDFR